MAFPQVASVGFSKETSVTTTHDVTVPSGISSGDRLLLFIATDSTGGIASGLSGWTEVVSHSSGVVAGRVYTKVATGSESNFTYTTDSSGWSLNRCFRITGQHASSVPEGASTSGVSSTPNPPSLNPSGWGTEDTLWFAFAVSGNDSKATDYPTNFSGNQFTDETVAHALSIATREANAASQDPGTFTIEGSTLWLAFTVAVRPAPTALSIAADPGSYSLTGTAASLEVGRELAADIGAYTVSGTAAGLRKTYTPLSAEAGSYVISGTAAGLEKGFEVAANSGSYSVSGTAANLEHGHVLAASSGSFLVTGSDVDLSATAVYRIDANSGSVAVSGPAAALQADRLLEVEAGAVAVSGTAAGLFHGREVAADPGAYAVSGTSASLEYGRKVSAESGSYAVHGTAADLKVGYQLAAEAGSLTLTGIDAALKAAREIAVDSSSYVVLGTAATLFRNLDLIEGPYCAEKPFVFQAGSEEYEVSTVGTVQQELFIPTSERRNALPVGTVKYRVYVPESEQQARGCE